MHKATKLTTLAIATLFIFGAASTRLSADTITFIGSGTLSGLPASATATFSTGTNSINISLTDTVGNPTSVIQNLSDQVFTFSGVLTGTPSITSSSGLERTVGKTGSFTNGSVISTGWVLSTSGSTLTLDDLANGGAGPAHTIIGSPDGSNIYSNANGSIAGNKPHNPFLAGTATFALHVPGVTRTTRITGATFSFGTTNGNDMPGTPSPVPEPGSLALWGSGLLALGGALRRRLIG